jgi:putative YhbY family RNA-binding protein
MTAITLSPAQRKAHRAKAHPLKPVIMIGNDGFTPAVAKETELALKSHGLIKIRVLGDDRDAREKMFLEICDQLNAAPIQHIGKLLVIWRPQKSKEEKVAPSKKVARAYKVARVAKKTAGSRIGMKGTKYAPVDKPKRRKVRQASPKKAALN